MKNQFFTVSLLLLTSSALLSANKKTIVHAKKTASAPASNKQEPFKSLEKQTPEEQTQTVCSTTSYRDCGDQSFDSMFKTMQREIAELNNFMNAAQASAITAGDQGEHRQATNSAQYSIKDAVTKDVNGQNIYELSIGMPGYTTDDITVTFHQSKHRDKEKSGKTLEIYAKKPVIQEEAQEKNKEQKEKQTYTKFSQQFSSTSIVNGKKQELIYKDGILKIKLDLPSDVSEEFYTMSLENDTLKIGLPKTSDDNTTKVLEFKKSSSK